MIFFSKAQHVFILTLSLWVVCAAGRIAAQGTPPTAKPGNMDPAQAEFFEAKVRPVLVGNCVKCHGPSNAGGGLRLDTKEGLLKGGGRGALVTPRRPAESLLLKAISYTDSALKMPPNQKLSNDQIAALTEWVAKGAVWPDYGKGEPIAGLAGLWALQPVRKPAPPKVKNPGWVRNPIDSFLLARLEAKGMQPAPPAGKREMLRRVTFDLTGLPPTPAELAAYLADRSPNAYEKQVDRLLASPQYGERWARYWLDLVRYADSNGYERDAEKPYSWKYRDYVIQALNEDRPYNRFVMEQLAGDELPDRTESTVAATGFLRLGTWDDEPNDPLQYKYERLDDLVHATGTAFLGLTVRCARCHDHKFDPIPQKDYYAFAAAFYGGYLEPGDGRLMGGPPPEKLGFPVLGFTDRSRKAPPLHLLVNGDPRRENDVVEPGYLSLLARLNRPVAPPPADAATTRRRLQLAAWITDPRNPLTARVIVNRIWQHHFGQGLVRTPNNFGRKGTPPTHPELLDWLASAFMEEDRRQKSQSIEAESQKERKPERKEERGNEESRKAGKEQTQYPIPNTQHLNAIQISKPETRIPKPYACGWQFKKLHRLIVTSSAYRMGSLHPQQETYSRKDFANENLWRFDRQRLDADALRDAMLAVSGQLNVKSGGPGFLPSVTREALEGLSRKGAEWTPSPPEEQNRRSIYMFLKRALLLPLLTVFDFADTTQPLEQRDVTTVAPQALALLNNPFVNQQSEAFARRVEAEAGNDPAKQIERAWQLALGRSPTVKERTEVLTYLSQFPVDQSKIENRKSKIKAQALRLWLRADRGIVMDAGGTVRAWLDQSGKGFHAAQPEAGAQPLLVANVLQGRPALRFDGKGTFLHLPAQIVTSQQFSLFAVASDRSANGAHREIFSNWNGKAGNSVTSLFLGATGESSARLSDDFSPVGALAHREQPFLLTGISGPGSVTLYEDRNEIARKVSPLAPRNLAGPYVIGQQGNINGEFWNGDILELQVYDRALTDAERDQVWEDLHQRYGIAARPKSVSPALVSLCHILLNANEFLYVD